MNPTGRCPICKPRWIRYSAWRGAMSRDRARQEKDDFCDLPFVDGSKDRLNPDRWSPAPVKLQDADRAARTEELLGRVYALDLINHMRSYNDFTECLSDVVEAIVKRGKWGKPKSHSLAPSVTISSAAKRGFRVAADRKSTRLNSSH